MKKVKLVFYYIIFSLVFAFSARVVLAGDAFKNLKEAEKDYETFFKRKPSMGFCLSPTKIKDKIFGMSITSDNSEASVALWILSSQYPNGIKLGRCDVSLPPEVLRCVNSGECQPVDNIFYKTLQSKK